MDIYLKVNMHECRSLLEGAGFRMVQKSGYEDAVYTTVYGRYHMHCISLPPTIYIDFHFDLYVHFLFVGVFYQLLTEEFFKVVVLPKLLERKVPYSAHRSSWFHRRNKAVFWGVRI